MKRFAEVLRQLHHGVEPNILLGVLDLGDMSLSDPGSVREFTLAQPGLHPKPSEVASEKLAFRLTIGDTLFCHHRKRAFPFGRGVLFGIRLEQCSPSFAPKTPSNPRRELRFQSFLHYIYFWSNLPICGEGVGTGKPVSGRGSRHCIVQKGSPDPKLPQAKLGATIRKKLKEKPFPARNIRGVFVSESILSVDRYTCLLRYIFIINAMIDKG
jgi:hypothetical protein